MGKVIVLLDDQRNFTDRRDAHVAKTVNEAIIVTSQLQEIDELWLDYILTPGDTLPFLWHLVERKNKGDMLKIGRVIFHSSSTVAKPLIDIVGEKAGFPPIELPCEQVTETTIG